MSGVEGPDPWSEVLEWLRVAASDRRAAEACIGTDPPLRDIAAYHCQQAAEKLLKGFLVLGGHHVRKTHDLDTLANDVLAHFPSLGQVLAPVRSWTLWSVAYRYPSEAGTEPEPDEADLAAALRHLGALENALRSLEPGG